MYFKNLIVCLLLLSSCSIYSKKKKEWIDAYKKESFISCVKGKNKTLFQNDLSEAINFEIISNTLYVKEADSIGRVFYESIQASPIRDYNQRKPIVNECLDFYQSKTLDSMAKVAYRSNKHQN